MTLREIEDALNATPFVPFDIHLDNGKIVQVPHHDFLLFNESKTGVVVASGERLHIMAVDHITSLSDADPDFTRSETGPSQG